MNEDQDGRSNPGRRDSGQPRARSRSALAIDQVLPDRPPKNQAVCGYISN